MKNQLVKRIEERLESVGLKPSAASIMAGLSKDAIRNLQRGGSTSMRAESLEALAPVLQTSVEWLVTGDTPDETKDENAPASRSGKTTTEKSGRIYTIGIYGKAAGSILGADILSPTPLDEQPVSFSVFQIKDAYGLWVEGDSMSPKFKHGEPIIVAPHRPKKSGDYVVVQVMQDGELRALVKKYISFDEKTLRLEQYNPAGTIEIPREVVFRVDRILEPYETWG